MFFFSVSQAKTPCCLRILEIALQTTPTRHYLLQKFHGRLEEMIPSCFSLGFRCVRISSLLCENCTILHYNRRVALKIILLNNRERCSLIPQEVKKRMGRARQDVRDLLEFWREGGNILRNTE